MRLAGNCSTSCVNKNLQALSSIFTLALEKKLIASRPRTTMSRVSGEWLRFLTSDEEQHSSNSAMAASGSGAFYWIEPAPSSDNIIIAGMLLSHLKRGTDNSLVILYTSRKKASAREPILDQSLALAQLSKPVGALEVEG